MEKLEDNYKHEINFYILSDGIHRSSKMGIKLRDVCDHCELLLLRYILISFGVMVKMVYFPS